MESCEGNKSILIFGIGPLQKSLIEQCKKLGIYTVGLDITRNASCKDDVDAFEVAAGDDYETTLAVANKYHVSGVITAATDKPLSMMARVAKELHLPFFSTETAEWSTDKWKMKERFQKFGVPCTRGVELSSAEELEIVPWNYPVIVKPRDNSGSRGVIYCAERTAAIKAISEAFEYTHKNSVLVEEFVSGQEYSIESLHYKGQTYVTQFTQKITTKFPYNVELGHIQPAALSDEQKNEIRRVVSLIADALNFDNCASHTELKINEHGIIVIETSPRLGGDFITSRLTPLSTGVNLEQLLIRMSLGEEIDSGEFEVKEHKSSGVVFFELPEGRIESIGDIDKLSGISGFQEYSFEKKAGDEVQRITNSLKRYGHIIFQTEVRTDTIKSMEEAKNMLCKIVRVE